MSTSPITLDAWKLLNNDIQEAIQEAEIRIENAKREADVNQDNALTVVHPWIPVASEPVR